MDPSSSREIRVFWGGQQRNVYLCTAPFLEKYVFSVVDKKACLDGWGGYFSRKRLALMAGVRISRLEKYASIYWIFIVNIYFMAHAILAQAILAQDIWEGPGIEQLN